jgi:hypothetical protein
MFAYVSGIFRSLFIRTAVSPRANASKYGERAAARIGRNIQMRTRRAVGDFM